MKVSRSSVVRPREESCRRRWSAAPTIPGVRPPKETMKSRRPDAAPVAAHFAGIPFAFGRQTVRAVQPIGHLVGLAADGLDIANLDLELQVIRRKVGVGERFLGHLGQAIGLGDLQALFGQDGRNCDVGLARRPPTSSSRSAASRPPIRCRTKASFRRSFSAASSALPFSPAAFSPAFSSSFFASSAIFCSSNCCKVNSIESGSSSSGLITSSGRRRSVAESVNSLPSRTTTSRASAWAWSSPTRLRAIAGSRPACR